MIIYKIENKINGKVYIGQTVKSLNHRKNQHIKSAERGGIYMIQKAIRKYGADNFEWSIICETDSFSKLNVLEKFYIAAYKKMTDVYNMTDGRDGALGRKMTESGRKKIGEANSRRIVKESSRKKMSEKKKNKPTWNKGKKYSDEYKKKLSEIRKGELNAKAILNEQQVLIIKYITSRNLLTLKEIANFFGVSSSAISDIKKNRNWKHLNRV